MPQVRCTRCGAINDTEAPDFPFCVGCQDNLAKCGACQWFDDQQLSCTQSAVAGLFEVGPEATPPCSYHTFRRSHEVRSKAPWIWIAVGLAATLFTLVLALWQLREVSPPTPAPRPVLRLELAVDAGSAEVGVPRTLAWEVRNVSPVAAKEVRLLIDKESLQNFEVRGQPQGPGRWLEERGWWALELGPLGGGERQTGKLELIPKQTGEHQLVVKLESSPNLYHGQSATRIVVEGDAGREEE